MIPLILWRFFFYPHIILQNMTISQELSNYIFTSKYARYLPEKKRRETWRESVDRVRNMMLEKYKDYNVEEDINWAYDLMFKKKVLGSQRALQFGGKAVLDHNCRSFNCSASYCDRLRFFQECMYVLLCGCGVGFSVQFQHVNKLPKFHNINTEKKIYQIPDTIEGWADSIGILLSSYFENPIFPEYHDYEVEFDYSLIRPKGSYLSSSSGKAPGSEPLKFAHIKIKELLEDCLLREQDRLRPIDAHDLICHLSDAVLAGGVRRSALLSLFSKDDKEMFAAKTDDWFDKNRQRSRANNSCLLLRDSTNYEEFQELFKYTKEYGDPGIVWSDDLEYLLNPCQPGWAKILTKNGIKEISKINIGEEIWSSEGWTKVINKWSSGVKDVYKIKTTSGIFYGTLNHKIISNNEKIEAKDAESIDILEGQYKKISQIYPQLIMDGLVIGDGSIHKASNNLIYLCIGSKDYDYFNSEIKNYITKERPGLSPYSYEIKTNIKYTELPRTYNRRIPKRYLEMSYDETCSFLRGLFSANGTVVDNRISLKSSSLGMIEDIQLLLSSIGIKSYFTTNKTKKIKFKNGEYQTKQSYDINITTDRQKFIENIGFIQEYKNNKINLLKTRALKKIAYDIISKEYYSTEEVFDITVDNQSHTYWTQGCNVSNCAEVGLYAYDENGNSGWEFCNLCTINSGNIADDNDLYERAKAATIIGTLQAGFNNFKYLGEVTENINKKEALLGISLSGIMEKTEITLDKKVLKKAVKIIKETNEDIARKININPAARSTCIKPDGNSSSFLATSAGIHPHHFKRYIRRVQNNKTESVYKYFKSINQQATEESVWSANKNDDNILFPIEVPDGSKTKNQISALEMLDNIRLIQENWINTGKNVDRCVQPWLNHNISTTVIVKDDEWDDVIKRVYKDRQYFGGLSFLSNKGDKDYQQPPFSSVLTSREIVKEYGEASIWCSGLIELALQSFNNNLWDACDFAIKCQNDDAINHLGLKNYTNGAIKEMEKDFSIAGLKIRFLLKFNKFAANYFDKDVKRLTYCLKDVHNWKLYNDLLKNFKKIDYSQMIEEEDFTNLEGEVACAGGMCLL